MNIDTLIIKIVGKYTEDFQEQLKLKSILEETLNNYELKERCTDLVASDILEHAREYIMYRKFEGLSKKSLRNYTYEIVRFANAVNKPVNFITKTDLTLYFASFDNIKNTTLATRITIIATFFGWLFENDKISDNPAKKIKKPKIEKHLREPLSKEELEIVKEACVNLRERLLIEFLSSTGCRVGELEFLKIKHINIHKRQVLVTGKGNKQRIVIFNSKTKILLERYLNERGFGCEYVFATVKRPYKQLSIRQLERIVSDVGKRVKNRIFPHRFRHTFCTHKVESGMSMPVVQKLMGHESLGTTESYFKISDSMIENEYNRLSN